MRFFKQITIRRCIIALLLIYLLIATLFFHDEMELRERGIEVFEQPGMYRILDEEICPNLEITDLFAGNGSIFVFYEKAGLVNVYSDDGVFQYGIQIEIGQNSYIKIAYQDGLLYLDSQLNTLYAFDRDQVVEQIYHTTKMPDDIKKRYRELEENFSHGTSNTYDGKTYVLSKSETGIDVIEENGQSKTVITLPEKNILVSLPRYFDLLCCGVALYLLDKEKKKDPAPRRLGNNQSKHL